MHAPDVERPAEPTIAQLMEELGALRRENETLRHRLDAVEEGRSAPAEEARTAPGDTAPRGRASSEPGQRLSRRRLLRRTGSMVAAAAGAATIGSLSRPAPVAAADPFLLGTSNQVKGSTTLAAYVHPAPSAVGLGVTDRALAAFPSSASFAAHDAGTYRTAILGYTTSRTGTAIKGSAGSPDAIGVVGESGGIGVLGVSYTVGVRGDGGIGRGGVFSGMKAQIRLRPAMDATHPASGERGDLFVDGSDRLWFCKGGGDWHQLV